jgi:hypothetical protein
VNNFELYICLINEVNNMQILKLKSLILLCLSVIIISCSSGVERAQKQSYKAQGSIAEERLNLIDQYKKCVATAEQDKQKLESCDSYLKAAEALK